MTKELTMLSIKTLNKNNDTNIKYIDINNGKKLNNLDYNEAIKFVFDLVLQLEKLLKKGYTLKTNKLDKSDIVNINNNYLLIKYNNFTKSKNKEGISIYKIIYDLCIDLMKLNNLEDIRPTKLYYMLRRMKEPNNDFFFI
jgi:hypothetical protein